MTKYIFVTGGVVSGIGKGICASSIGLILKSMGYRTTIKKLDPYLNIDPGTMSPLQHGEVFVTRDGKETDMDLGHYERISSIIMNKNNSITSGKIYEELLDKERKGFYLGKTVQAIPHVTNLIKEFIKKDEENFDVIICEIGGTVGDVEANEFLEAARQMKFEYTNNLLFCHLGFIPYLSFSDEIKTKPLQHSVRTINSLGINPDIIIARTEKIIPKDVIEKISLHTNVKKQNIITSLNLDSIYKVVEDYISQGLDKSLISLLNLEYKECDLKKYREVLLKQENLDRKINIMIAGKYGNQESYKSLIEAINHACIHNDSKLNISWINTKNINSNNIDNYIFKNIDGIIIPGGFGHEGTETKISIIKYARENNIPIIGICLGFQLMFIEYFRNVLNYKEATSSEFDINSKFKLVDELIYINNKKVDKTIMGATMRLGSYKANILNENSLLYKIYNKKEIEETHRHRYEINHNLIKDIDLKNLIISSKSVNENLIETLELKNHNFFIGVQYHPELRSQFIEPHPLFYSFIKNILNKNKRNILTNHSN